MRCWTPWRSEREPRKEERRTRLLAGIALASLLVPAAGLAAQPSPTSHDAPAWQGELATIGANMVLGGLTSGFLQRARGESFADGFVRGAAGGGVVYLGKKVSAEGFAGSGIAGRKVAAAGSSMVENAGAGRGVVDRLTIPAGPLWLHFDRTGNTPFAVKLDVPAAVIIGYALTRSDLRFDPSTSISAGVPVFTYLGDRSWLGRHVGGVVFLAQEGPVDEGFHCTRACPRNGHTGKDAARVHEQIHVAQRDFAAIAWGHPADGWLLERSRPTTAFHRHFALGSDYLLWGILHAMLDYDDQPWEWEAHFLMNP